MRLTLGQCLLVLPTVGMFRALQKAIPHLAWLVLLTTGLVDKLQFTITLYLGTTAVSIYRHLLKILCYNYKIVS